MANATVVGASYIRGSDPQNCIEYITRKKIYDSRYWKEECFGINEATFIDKAVAIDHIGGTIGASRLPTPFLCLSLKLLQLQPIDDIALEMIRDESFPYLRLLAAFYWRLTASAADIYRHLEPLYADYRTVRQRTADGAYVDIHVDEVIEAMLTQSALFDIAMPFMQKRSVLQASGKLAARISTLSAEELEAAALETLDNNKVNGVSNHVTQPAVSPVTDKQHTISTESTVDTGVNMSDAASVVNTTDNTAETTTAVVAAVGDVDSGMNGSSRRYATGDDTDGRSSKRRRSRSRSRSESPDDRRRYNNEDRSRDRHSDNGRRRRTDERDRYRSPNRREYSRHDDTREERYSSRHRHSYRDRYSDDDSDEQRRQRKRDDRTQRSSHSRRSDQRSHHSSHRHRSRYSRSRSRSR